MTPPLGYKWCNSEENNSIANLSEAQGDTIVKECIERLSVCQQQRRRSSDEFRTS